MTTGLFFDWYACSVDHNPDLVMVELLGSYPHGTWENVKPKNGYTDARSLVLPDLSVAATLWWGGASQGAAVYAFATGSNAHTFSSVIRSLYPVHRLVRADIAVDFNESGAWVSLNSLAHNLHENKFVRKTPHYVGELGKEAVDSPDVKGRTIYLGSRQSVHMARFYEKGKKDNPSMPDWVRVEVEFKPRDGARYAYASATPAECLAATRLGAELLRVLLNSSALRPCPAGAVRSLTDFERSASALVSQWSPFIRKLLQERFHGDMLACMAYLAGEAA